MTEQQDIQGTQQTQTDAAPQEQAKVEAEGRQAIQDAINQAKSLQQGGPPTGNADTVSTEDQPTPKAKDAKPTDSEKDHGGKAGTETYEPTPRQKKAAEQLGYDETDTERFTERDYARLEKQWTAQRKLEQTIGTLTQQVKGLQKAQQQPAKPKDDDLYDEIPTDDEPTGRRRTVDVDDRGLPSDLDDLAISPDDEPETVARKSKALIQGFKAMQEQMQAFQAKDQERAEREAEEAQAQVQRETDSWFSKLDPADWSNDDGSPMFGEGPVSELDGRSTEAKLAKAIIAKASQLMPELELEEALDAALLALHKDRYLTAAGKRKTDARDRKRQGSTAGATPRSAPPTSKTPEQERHEEANNLAAAIRAAIPSARVKVGS